jgi:hypothetical protein
MGLSKRAALENCLDFPALKKDFALLGFVCDPRESDWNVLTVRKTKSAIDFSAEVYNDIIRVPSGKAYAQIFVSYRAPPKPLPGLELAYSLAPTLDVLMEGVPHVNFDPLIMPRSARTEKQHAQAYQLGIVVLKNAEAEMRAAVCDALKYVSTYVEKQAKSIAQK